MASYGWCLLGEKGTGANPTDRAKSGTMRSMVVDGNGVPIGITVDAANRHDMKMTRVTLQSIVVRRPEPTTRTKQHMWIDKEYDYPEVHELWLYNSYPLKRRTQSEL